MTDYDEIVREVLLRNPPADEVEKWSNLLQAQKEFESRHPEKRPGVGPLFVAAANQRLEAERLKFASGEQMALFAAIRICAAHEMVLVDWVAEAFISRYDAVLNFRSKSWDDAFGKPYKKGLNLASARKKRTIAPAVGLEIVNRRMRGAVIDEALFEEVGKQFNIGKTLCSEYWYEWSPTLTGKVPRKSQKQRKEKAKT